MKKGTIIFLTILLATGGGMLWYDFATYTPCSVTQRLYSESNFSDLKITFNPELSAVDSFHIGTLSWKTSCVQGTLEENASWSDSSYKILVKEIAHQSDGSIRLSTTIEHDAMFGFDRCETPGKLYVPVVVYSGNKVKTFTLRTGGPEIKTTRI